jgi:hypothetical protein
LRAPQNDICTDESVKKLPSVKNHANGENSAILVTLTLIAKSGLIPFFATLTRRRARKAESTAVKTKHCTASKTGLKYWMAAYFEQ